MPLDDVLEMDGFEVRVRLAYLERRARLAAKAADDARRKHTRNR